VTAKLWLYLVGASVGVVGFLVFLFGPTDLILALLSLGLAVCCGQLYRQEPWGDAKHPDDEERQ
jgi:hypothetical protein